MKNRTKLLAFSAVTGALYAVLTIILAPISFGAVQFRISEALCILPFFIPETSIGLFAGCFIANLTTGVAADIIFGPLATLAACLAVAAAGRRSRSFRSKIIACAAPVVFNALVIGVVITAAYCGMNPFRNPEVFALYALEVGAGEAGVMYLIGLPLMHWIEKSRTISDYIESFREEKR